MAHPNKDAMAALNRLDEFVAHLESRALSEGEKHALVAPILGSLEGLSDKGEIPSQLWDRVARLLRAKPGLYADLVEQWGTKSDDPDGFAISTLLQPLQPGAPPAKAR